MQGLASVAPGLLTRSHLHSACKGREDGLSRAQQPYAGLLLLAQPPQHPASQRRLLRTWLPDRQVTQALLC